MQLVLCTKECFSSVELTEKSFDFPLKLVRDFRNIFYKIYVQNLCLKIVRFLLEILKKIISFSLPHLIYLIDNLDRLLE